VVKSKDCSACEDLNLDLIRGYQRWQQLFEKLKNGELELTDGSKVQTPEALKGQIESAMTSVRDAERKLNSASNAEERASAAANRQTAQNSLRDLQGKVDQSYQITKNLFDDYDKWRRNLASLEGGAQALQAIRDCHSLVAAGKCEAPFQCKDDPNCIFGPNQPLEGLDRGKEMEKFQNIPLKAS